ncbi:Uncharacterised protein [Chlamydia abortus]|jgi:hypothetical protein|uniref:Uncharacterized protein n=1 Tax=Paenibacillus residui TaxID=629724 RepID=A0ABW3D6C1_9BACL|nr:hypothetical protein [Paenibacillus sp. 32O-W]SHE11208.1 Uncharacterised protein [Chlamydia abortus]
MNPTPEQQQLIKDYIILDFVQSMLEQDENTLLELHFSELYLKPLKEIQLKIREEFVKLKARFDDGQMTMPMATNDNVPGKLTYEYYIQEEAHKVRVHEKALQDTGKKVVEELLR